MISKAWLFFLLLVSFSLHANEDITVRLGDERVIIRQISQGTGKHFVHLHQNETTALSAAKAVIMAEGGSVLTLVHHGERNIAFHLGKTRYEFDPNRIFTERGIQETLTRYGAYSAAAHQEVEKLAAAIKARLPKGKIIAVHNNREYSLKDYLPGHSLASDVSALHFRDKQNYRNFYLVTQPADFVRLQQLPFNSILQAGGATDDGSLSVYLSRSQYINVEAGYDQLAAQVSMLKTC